MRVNLDSAALGGEPSLRGVFDMSGQELRLAEELVLGVVRHVDSRCQELAGQLEVREIIAEADSMLDQGHQDLAGLAEEFPWM